MNAASVITEAITLKNRRQQCALATAAGGAMDAWAYFAQGQVFANSQSGNLVLMAIALAGGNTARAVTLLAFIIGMLASRLSGLPHKRRRLNSRNVRLAAECVMLVALWPFVHRMPDRAVTACVGLIAGVQMTSLSHIGASRNLRQTVQVIGIGCLLRHSPQ